MGIVTLSVAPFLDAAWVRDPNHRFGARKIQYDAGLQWIASTPGGTEIRLSYAWDLRNRRQSFYATASRIPEAGATFVCPRGSAPTQIHPLSAAQLTSPYWNRIRGKASSIGTTNHQHRRSAPSKASIRATGPPVRT